MRVAEQVALALTCYFERRRKDMHCEASGGAAKEGSSFRPVRIERSTGWTIGPGDERLAIKYNKLLP